VIAGFTGSSRGMSHGQCHVLKLLLKHYGVTRLHHGMCIGGDFQANNIARGLGIATVGHPPVNRSKYCPCVCDEVRLIKEYLVRNRNIVDEAEFLFVGPDQPEYLRSGTWSTKRYAEKIGKPFHILERGYIECLETQI